ncbi:signal recognition particle protein [endosymbiont 'TC1' of Trimyema compressum]|uniref:signal recognition particle protein n=1 Tax=endosymbiont 'TC1' of Trimyema compressum TaxID=243899 RepID=UPI0007F0D864|nr:signal recognition particle protein [endosymbiont 'TC1' of Trimyema compressum]AMP20578.1 signal recognition particle protein [endosymbiont 'TC1' of Trimyema compressum]
MGAFSSLTEKIQSAFAKLTSKGRLTEKEIDIALKEVQMALLEADVNFKVVKNFIKSVKEKSLGANILESLTPGQQVIDIVNKELVHLLGDEITYLNIAGKPPSIIMLIGLQGAGKTTTGGKLAYLLKGRQNKKPYLIAGDIYRPAAIDQLKTLGKKIDVPVFSINGSKDPVAIAKAGVEVATKAGSDVIIIDTAGRLHLDEAMMIEVEDIKKTVNPQEILLVVDGMTGQDAVNIGKEFNEKVGIDGIVLTKMDGDTRGGAAISIRAVTGKPIKLIGMGEKLDQLEFFHPDRIASRILGMGDILSLIEKAKDQIDEKEAVEMQKKLMDASFTFEDFLSQIKQLRNMGPIEDLLGRLPGMGNMKNLKVSDKDINKIEAIIFSMTVEERKRPEIMNGSRKKRIALGSGTEVQDVNRLLKQFESSKKMMKQMGNMGKKKKGFMPKFF